MNRVEGPPLEEILHLTSLAEVFGGFAHEIAQPLNAIMIASQVLQLKVQRSVLPDSEKAFLIQRLNIVSDQVQRASDILDSLRSFTRRNAAAQVASNLEKVFHRVFGLMEQQFIMRSIEVTVTSAGNLQPIFSGIETIERIIIQGLAFSRDAVSAIGKCYASEGTAYEKKLGIHLDERDGAPIMTIDWGSVEIAQANAAVQACVNVGLSTATSLLTAEGGSLTTRADGLTIVFPPSTEIHR